MDYQITITFTDEKGMKTSKRFETSTPDVDTGLEFAALLSDLDGIVAAFAAVSSAAVSGDVRAIGAAAGVAGEAGSEVANVAHLNLYISPPPAEKLYSLDVPSPIDALFVGGSAGTVVDASNAALIALVAEVAANWEVSDGESIDVATTNGIKNGEWRSRARQPK